MLDIVRSSFKFQISKQLRYWVKRQAAYENTFNIPHLLSRISGLTEYLQDKLIIRLSSFLQSQCAAAAAGHSFQQLQRKYISNFFYIYKVE